MKIPTTTNKIDIMISLLQDMLTELKEQHKENIRIHKKQTDIILNWKHQDKDYHDETLERMGD